jgi:outer membrane protein assembly factor BamD
VRLALVIASASCLVAGIALPGCGGPQSGPALSYGESARRDYERALGAFQDNDCLTAVPLLQNVRREYPYSRYAALAELRLADCELQQQHYTEAIRGYRAFVRQRPTHPEVDTASFAIAQAYFRQIPQDFFLSPPPEERDQAATRNALRIVRRFLLEFPDSDHLEEARTLERAVLSLLARHDLYVASYYLARDRPAATIMRIDALIEQYEGSGVEPEAMLLRGRTYLHMREQRQARLAFGELIRRYPESGFAVQARSYLRAMGVDPADAIAEGDGGDDDGEGRLPPAPPPDDGDDLGGIAPGTDIDDVTDVTDETQRQIDTAEDAAESGLEVTEEGDVEAGEIEDEDLRDPEE